MKKLFELLLDNQFTCYVTVNPEFLSNIRKCKWKLVSKTQEGVCQIKQIGHLPGVGTVWYYPNGVVNILSQNLMATQSNWDIAYSTRRYK